MKPRVSLSGIASLAEIITAVVVIVSIVFIYRELEQNRLATQDASYQQFLSNLTGLEIAEAGDPELSRLADVGERHPEMLSESEWNRFKRLTAARVAQMEYAYLSRLNGTMHDTHWSGVRPHLNYLMCLPGYRKFLDSGMSEIYADSFVDYVRIEVIPACP